MKSLIFQSWGIRAIQDGTKTMTRRIINIPEIFANPSFVFGQGHEGEGWYCYESEYPDEGSVLIKPKIQIGEIFYARETYSLYPKGIIYKADYPHCKKDYTNFDGYPFSGWKSSMFMPEKYARIFLKCTDVKPERAQDISEEDILKEGFKMNDPAIFSLGYKGALKKLWIDINGQKSWDSNPWVWVYTFKECDGDDK